MVCAGSTPAASTTNQFAINNLYNRSIVQVVSAPQQALNFMELTYRTRAGWPPASVGILGLRMSLIRCSGYLADS
jgi:hypothetical protein